MSHRAARQNIGSLRVNLSNLQIFMIFVIFNNTESNTSKAKYVECGSDLLENVKEVYICFESSLLALLCVSKILVSVAICKYIWIPI